VSWSLKSRVISPPRAIANQYLAIPLIACAVQWKNPFGWAYMGVATLALLASPDKDGALPAMQTVAAQLRALGVALAPEAHSALWPQLCLMLFLAAWLIGWIATADSPDKPE